MLKPTPPSTLDGIKRLANTLKKTLRIPLHQGLDIAATRAGYQNFRHAQGVLANGASAPQGHTPIFAPKHRLYISARWASNSTGLQGVEVWHVDLSRPHAELVTRSQMGMQTALARLVPRAPDHFFCSEYNFESQEQARGHVCRALRTWQFLDATGLRPSTAHSRLYPEGDYQNAIPGKDHARSWYDPATKSYVMTDEPYEPRTARYSAQRTEWAQRHGYDVLQPTWPGMYLPDPGSPSGTRLYLVASKTKGPDLNAMVQALNQLPAPPTIANWNGNSISGRVDFISPQGQAPRPPVPRKPAARAPQPPKPNSMPLATHEAIGRQLKGVAADTYMRDGVRNRMVQLQGTLDSYVQREHPSFLLTLEQLDNLYYGDGPATTFAKSIGQASRAAHLATLQQVKQTLERHYDHENVRPLTGRIDQMAKSLASWN